MDEKSDAEQADDEAREREAAELQAQIDEIVSGKVDSEALKPRTLRDLTRVDRKNLIRKHSQGSEESVKDSESETENE